LIPLSRVAELLLKRPVHSVVVVVKATATEPWYATADEEEQRTVGTLLEELAPAEPKTQRQESGTADGDDSGARWAVHRGKHSREASRPCLGEPGWSVTAGRYGPLADGEWTTSESPAEECAQSVQERLDGDERGQASAQGRAGQKLRGRSMGKQKGLFGVFSEDFLLRLLAHKPPSLLDGSTGGPTWDPLPAAAPGHPEHDLANLANTGAGEKGPHGQLPDPVSSASVADGAEEPATAAARWADCDSESQCAVSCDVKRRS